MKYKFITSNDIKLIKRAFKYVFKYKIRFIITIICMISVLLINVIQPLIWGRMLEAMYSKNISVALTNTTIIFIIVLSRMTVLLIQNYFTTYLSQNIYFDIKRDVFKKILNMPVKSFDKMRTGDFINKMIDDVYLVSSVITNQFLMVVIDIIQVLAIGIIAFKISIPLAFILLGAFPISQLVFLVFGFLLRKKQEKFATLGDSYYSFLIESISGIREIKNLGAKNWRFSNFIKLASSMKQITISKSVLELFARTFSQIVNTTSQLAVMGVGAYFIFKNIIPVHIFISFTLYSGQFSMSLINITSLNSTIQKTLTSLERIFALLDNREEIFGQMSIKEIHGDVSFSNVTYSYTEGLPTLKNISFEMQKNKVTAIVGPSGSGKTTILNLLLKFYDTVEGNIYIDDINLGKFCEDSLRKHISIVRQEPILFNLTIYDNFLLVYPDASEKEIYEACKIAYIHDFIFSLPDKYNTIIEEKGVNLSGGQKQRLAIARALLKKSKIIIFDEATSSLDNESQNYIRDAITKISKSHTVIIVAHRLSTVIEADHIVILENGQIVGQGKHNALICKNEFYRRLYENEVDIFNSQSNFEN